MSDKEKAEIDLAKIVAFEKLASSNYSQYNSLVIERMTGEFTCYLLIEGTKVNYLSDGVFEMHLFGGVQTAQQWFYQKGEYSNSQAAKRFLKAAQDSSKASLTFVQGGTFAKCNGFTHLFTDKSLLRLMAINAYPSAKLYLESIINL